MVSRITNTVLDTHDNEAVAAFWCEVLGWTERERDDEVITIGPTDDPLTAVDVVVVSDDKTVKNRLHFDLRADGTSTAAELDRLVALGATRVDVGQGPDVTWTVLADPEGNEFCLLSRTVQETNGV